MILSKIEELNKEFSFSEDGSELHFVNGKSGIPLVEIKNAQANASISLQGAHLLNWKPHTEDEVIWLSNDAKFEKGKSIRGGIPICWPWFGAHDSNTLFPAHGFARTVLWHVLKTQNISPDETQITLRLSTNQLDQSIHEMWPFDTVVEYRITVSNTLKLELITYNGSNKDITVGQALHTYFNIGNISNTTVYGLEDLTYLDKPDNFCSKLQKGAITINNEVDRVYLDSIDDVTIDNKQRKIIIKKQGSHTTVVWNPWQEVANKMGDLGENGYKEMLCVESANAADDLITIKAGESYTLSAIYETEQ